MHTFRVSVGIECSMTSSKGRTHAVPPLRIARPTDRLDAMVAFYRDAIGLAVLGSFDDHDGVDGVMLGFAGALWHLELTHTRGHVVGRAPNADHLLVLYLPDDSDFTSAVQRMETSGHRPVASLNPYWDRCGRTYEDPDGYRVVFAHSAPPV